MSVTAGRPGPSIDRPNREVAREDTKAYVIFAGWQIGKLASSASPADDRAATNVHPPGYAGCQQRFYRRLAVGRC